jgi:hypothetical protein
MEAGDDDGWTATTGGGGVVAPLTAGATVVVVAVVVVAVVGVADADEARLPAPTPASGGRVLRSSFSRLRDSAKEGLSLDLYRVQCAASWASSSGPGGRAKKPRCGGGGCCCCCTSTATNQRKGYVSYNRRGRKP